MLPLLFNCGRFLIEQGGEGEVSIFLRCDTLSYSFTASSFIFVLLWESWLSNYLLECRNIIFLSSEVLCFLF